MRQFAPQAQGVRKWQVSAGCVVSNAMERCNTLVWKVHL
jgi:ribosomal protein L16 Arg81 hydroxylase